MTIMEKLYRENSVFSFKGSTLFIVLSFFYVIVTYLINKYVLDDNYLYHSFSGHLSTTQISSVIDIRNRFEWIIYASLPLLLVIKIVLVSACVYAGAVFGGYKIRYADIFKIIMLADLVLVLALVVKLFYFLLAGAGDADTVKTFYPLSVMQLLDSKTIPNYLVYPLQLINVFEIGYCLVIALGLRAFLRSTLWSSLKLVASTYGVALLVWSLLTVFLLLQHS
jgi:hypothetical protein